MDNFYIVVDRMYVQNKRKLWSELSTGDVIFSLFRPPRSQID